MIVLDASAVVELLFQTRAGREIAERIAEVSETLHAPHLLDVEVAQVMRRFVLAGAVDAARASHAMNDLVELDVARYPHDALLPRVWQLRQNLSAYDAVYVALAEALDAPLLSADQRLARSAGHAARIELVTAGG